MKDGDGLTNRVWTASQQRSIDSEVRGMHLARIRGELERPIHVAPTVMTTAPVAMARRWRLAATAAALAVLPAIALTTASSAVPGDRLYSTKRAVERAMIVVDDDVVAANRVEELESLIRRQERPEVIAAAQQEAGEEIRWFPRDHQLTLRLSELFIGWGSEQYRLDRSVDWSEGDLFASSLPDGNLLWISRQAGTSAPDDYELSVSGPWMIEPNEHGWRISNPDSEPASDDPTAFDIEVGTDGILITSIEDPDEPEESAPTTTSSVPSSIVAGAPSDEDPVPSSEPPATTTTLRPGPPTTSDQGSNLTQPTRPTTTSTSTSTSTST
jgi:hypothetical protein